MSGTLGGFYLPTHEYQYAVGNTQDTRRYGCTWVSLATGADAATAGKVNRTPDQIHALVKPSEETNQNLPGWSIPDAIKAADRLSIPVENLSGKGFVAVDNAHKAGKYVLLQGDSDRFGDATCSGAFDGDHCIGVHPATRRTAEGVTQWFIDDPICPGGRWEAVAVISSYARKLSSTVLAMAFTNPVVKPPQYLAVVISGATPLYDKPQGTRVGTVTRASYRCTRQKIDGAWWYRIVTNLAGGKTTLAGRYFKGNGRVMEVRYL